MPKPTKVPGLGRGTPLAVGGPLLLRARLADVRRYEGDLARGGEPDEDAVHDMRVATRRLRAALEALADPELASLEDEVKGLQDALGAVRDVQVLRRWLGEHAPGDGQPLVRAIASGLPAASEALAAALAAWTGAVAPTILELSATHAGGPGTLRGGTANRALRRRLAAMARRIAPVLEDPSPRRAHRLRIAAKKVRYLAELATPARRRPAKTLLALLKPLQERLGELHDADVRLERLEELARGPGKVVAERLLEAERRERARLARALVRDLRPWHDDDLAGQLRRGFAKRERRLPTSARRAADAARHAPR